MEITTMPQDQSENDAQKNVPESDLTQVQSDEAMVASAELSIPTHVRQNTSAPKIGGYVLTEPLGEGAYGQVWRAWQMRTKKEVAVKIFMRRSGLDWIFLQREVERLTRLDRHPFIVTLLDISLGEEPPFYVMDLIEGGSLQQYVNPQSPLSSDRTLPWMSQICDALSYVHAKGLIHCDLKPANILVDGRDHIRVVDFGQSRVFTESAASMGTLFYMAPEQAMLAEEGNLVQPDVRWDIYAFGASMYALLTGQVPYANAESVKQLEAAPNLKERLVRYRALVTSGSMPSWESAHPSTLKSDLMAVVDKCMARMADDRYDSISQVGEDITAIYHKRPVTPLAHRSGYRAKRFFQRNPFMVGMAGTVLALLIVMILAGMQRARLDRAKANDILASYVHSPLEAISETASANNRVKGHLQTLTERFLSSPAFTERIMGARAAPWVDPQALWKSIDGGPLWRNGEWLELAEAFGRSLQSEGSSRPVALDMCLLIESKLASGSAREKYVAYCLLGQFPDAPCGLGDRCLTAAQNEKDPSVWAAAKWAATRMGLDVPYPDQERMFVDDLTGLTFVSIPPEKAFVRGSVSDDPDRLEDEDRSGQAVSIDALHLSTTEVTLAAFAEFWQASRLTVGADAIQSKLIDQQFAEGSSEEANQRALGFVSLTLARHYTQWLNQQASGSLPKRIYRLPTEDEWEYACRGGNPGRFCYGDDTKYAPYFAACNGEVQSVHRVAQRMPNFFGLFDMHGGLWELTASRYPSDLAPTELASSELFVKRGGAFYNPARRCRSAQRNYIAANGAEQYTGIRLVMVLKP